MKNIKHYIQRKPVLIKSYTTKGVKREYLYETFLERFLRKLKFYSKVGLYVTMGAWTFFLVGAVVYGEMRPVEVKGVEVQNEIPPVMKRIAEAESYNSHYCTKALVKKRACQWSEVGQVLAKTNRDGSIDVGRFAINVTRHGSEMTKLGLNVYNEKDNEAYAMYLYARNGSADWEATKPKWKR